MATFNYQALTSSGRLMRGSVEAGTLDEASDQLEQMQLTINTIEKVIPASGPRHLGRDEFLLFNQQLASLAQAGIPLEKGLRELSLDLTSPKLKKLIDRIATDLESGTPIEEAFDRCKDQFPPLYSRVLRAGIKTGRLSEMLTTMTRHLELCHQTRRIIIEAVTYPVVILLLAGVIITVIFQFVVPQFREVLHEMVGGQLNPVTQFVLDISGQIIHLWASLGVIVIALVLLWHGLAASGTGRQLRERLIHTLPVIGRIVYSSRLGRFAESLALMVQSGCDLPAGLRLAGEASASECLNRESDLLAQRIEEGNQLLESGQWCRAIPRLFLYSMQLGMQRNELTENLRSLADMYREQANFNQSRLHAVLMPSLIIFVGGIIAMSILAMFLPMIQVVSALGGG